MLSTMGRVQPSGSYKKVPSLPSELGYSAPHFLRVPESLDVPEEVTLLFLGFVSSGL